MMTDCVHSNIEPTISAIASVMCIQISIFGFKCLDCEKQWDIGNAVEAFKRVDRLKTRIDSLEEKVASYRKAYEQAIETAWQGENVRLPDLSDMLTWIKENEKRKEVE